MNKHTPGPWAIRRGHSTIEIRATAGLEIAQTTSDAYWQNFSEEALANAHLIAAAPDMLEVLKALLPEVDAEIEQRQTSGSDEYWLGLKALSDTARAAIAKAEGRS